MQPVKLTKTQSLPGKMSSLGISDKNDKKNTASIGVSVPKQSGISINKAVAKKISQSQSQEDEEKMNAFLSLEVPHVFSILSKSTKEDGLVSTNLNNSEIERDSEIEKLFKLAETNSLSLAGLAMIVKSCGICSPEGSKIVVQVFQMFKETSTVETSLKIISAILKKVGKTIEPFLVPVFKDLIYLSSDRSAAVRELSATITLSLMKILCPFAFANIFPVIITAMKEEDWRIKVASLDALKAVSPRVSIQISPLLATLIPQVSECIIDTKKQVSTAGMEALLTACNSITNDDIRPLVPQLVSVIARPEETSKTMDSLLETTFVANVDSPTLALIAPLLGKALRGRVTILKRKSARVIDIMCRLVQDPSDVAPFVPLLLPALEKCIDEIVDAEVIQVTKDAKAVLLKAMGEGNINAGNAKKISASSGLDLLQVQTKLLESINKTISIKNSSISTQINQYISQVTSQLIVNHTLPNPNPESDLSLAWCSAIAMSTLNDWKECVTPFVASYRLEPQNLTTEEALDVSEILDDEFEEKVAMHYRKVSLSGVSDVQLNEDSDAGNVCNIEFSLAFGGKILLHNTRLRLGRGRRYAIMGKNGAGKTTLLTNIGTGNIEGMPAHLKTLYVQHDDQSDDHGVSIAEEMLTSKDLAGTGVTKDQILEALKKIKFTDEMIAGPRSGLSGGWMMKLIIVRAMLSKADILLMDEPTNHLDTASVQWLVDFIKSSSEITCMIVSHDTAFLDKVVTDVIHYENKKLVYYHGNLTHFVEIHPEAKYYYELESSSLKFKFPTPDRLDGINSTTRSVMKVENVTYTYPGATKPQLVNVSAKVCLASRIAVTGANGAGKSTLIKLLVQETKPDEGCGGEVWKHHNLRLAYVAQHSFHHIEQHLDETPVNYMKWRFHGGVDKEDLAKPNLKLTEEEEIDHNRKDKKFGDVDQIVGRRKVGRTMEYECTFVGQSTVAATYREKERKEENKYIPLETLVEMGLSKLVQQCDSRIAAAAAGLDIRPLVTAEIQTHLDDFNLEAEYGTHGSIRRLSGGQKVKLVLAAAMWNKPHIIVLDEPTNYLDREALGALTQAIKGFAGGVVIISHNAEFTDAICTEKWLIEGGKCHCSGEVEETDLKTASGKIKKSKSASTLDAKSTGEAAGVNSNGTFVSKVLLNPKTMESLSKKEVRLLTRCAEVAGVTLEDYVSKLTCKSPEWKWL